MAGLSQDFFSDIGGAVSGLFGAAGDKAEAKAYSLASSYALQNAKITEASTQIQEAQAQRKIFQTTGAQQAQVASAGFASSGSSVDLLRSSMQQGSLQKSLIREQGLINENGYQEEAARYQGMASAAQKAAAGSGIGGILKGIAGIASFIGFL